MLILHDAISPFFRASIFSSGLTVISSFTAQSICIDFSILFSAMLMKKSCHFFIQSGPIINYLKSLYIFVIAVTKRNLIEWLNTTGGGQLQHIYLPWSWQFVLIAGRSLIWNFPSFRACSRFLWKLSSQCNCRTLLDSSVMTNVSDFHWEGNVSFKTHTLTASRNRLRFRDKVYECLLIWRLFAPATVWAVTLYHILWSLIQNIRWETRGLFKYRTFNSLLNFWSQEKRLNFLSPLIFRENKHMN